jgi:3-hydroxybutyryl-CoA dehydratase
VYGSSFEELEVGARHVSRGRTITEADVVAFASLTGDRHPQHTDAEWAARSPFGERIAHGMLVLSYAAGLVPLDPDRVAALRRVRDAVFKRPVHLGDTIRVESRIAATDAATGVVTCAWEVRNQADRLVARATIDLLWRRNEPARADDADADAPAVDASGMVFAFTSVPL